MNWIILCVIAVIIFVFAFVGARLSDWYYEWFVMFAVTSGFLAVSFVMIYFAGTLDANKNIARFEQQKQYIESHQAQSEIEDAALTSKKIELNEWLYSAQWSRRKLGNWSFVPEYVLELEAIK